MHTKSVDLKEFYDTAQGRVVMRSLRRQIREFWPSVKGQRVVGIGYAAPYLRSFLGEADRVVSLSPAQHGAIFWPGEGNGLVSLCDESEWPIETNSVDRAIIVHMLDSPESVKGVLEECWRVLSGQGRLLVIVPNRAGVWARIDSTPFGHGTPWSAAQISALLKDNMFVPEGLSRALYFPPAASRLLLATAPLWERAGQKLCNAFGGVNIIEASKQLYAGVAVPAAVQRRTFLSPKPLVTSNPGNTT